MRFRIGVLALAGLSSACGGSGSPGSPSPRVSLSDGSYLLAVYSSALSCFMATFNQGAAPNSSVRIPVSVRREGDQWRVVSRDPAGGSLAMTLAPTAVGVDGQAWGTLVQPGTSVTLQHQVSGTGTGRGAAEGVVGSVSGTVNYSGTMGTAFCTANLWSLSREGP